jgi:hypothetical protein
MKSPASKSSLFLLELILSIFFFSIASGVCIQLFVKAHLLGVETMEFNQANLWSQNIAETFYASEDSALLLDLFPFQETSVKDTYVLNFGQDFQPMATHTDNTVYTLTITLSEDKLYQNAFLYVSKDDVFFDLQLKKYQQNRSVQIHE